MSRCTLKVEHRLVKIYINGIVHLLLKKEALLGFQSWIVGDGLRYCIEFQLRGGAVLADYDSRELWTEILKLLDEAALCE
jgi:hypothetical protein